MSTPSTTPSAPPSGTPSAEPLLIGHRPVKEAMAEAAAPTGGTRVIILVGGAGCGKSALLRWFAARGRPIVDVRAHAGRLSLRADPASVSEVVREIAQEIAGAPAAAPAGQDSLVAVYDDVDKDLAPATVPLFVRDLVQALDLSLVVLTMKTPPRREIYPVPVEIFSLERRQATREEFEKYLAEALAGHGSSLGRMSAELVRSLFQMQSQCPDFRAVAHIVENLARISRKGGADDFDLYRLLQRGATQRKFRSFPGVTATPSGRLIFRAKDKTEALRDMILDHYDDPEEFAVVAAECLPGFDAAAFLRDARTSYSDAVMALCLIQSPLRIVTSLFGPRDIIREIQKRGLADSREFEAPGSRARLLVRGLGFTLGDDPTGYSFYRQALGSSRALVDAENAPPEALRGSGLSLIQNVELMLADLAHFWGSLLFGSMALLVQSHNARSTGTRGTGRRLRPHRLTCGDLAALLRHLCQDPGDVRYSVGLLLTGRSRPLSDRFLKATENFVAVRNEFVHESRGGQHGRSQLKEMLDRLLPAAEELVDAAGESYPAVVKLTEIVFDEFGRRIYSAVDSDGRRVRFSLTQENAAAEKRGYSSLDGGGVSLSSHYFMMPAKPVTVDPVLVPRAQADVGVLFREAESYTTASSTQYAQAALLLDVIDLSGVREVLDVGCGDGRVTLEIEDRFPDAHIHGIDVSREMIRVARELARKTGSRVTFEEADVLDYDPGRTFDAVVSNSAMHWVLPAEAGYRALYRLLAPGGLLAVHQGGEATYVGLRTCALEVIEELGLTAYFAGWSYPAYYPTRAQLENLLAATGFTDIRVVSHESDGRELPSLVRDFAYAGLLPFLLRLPEDKRELLRGEFLRHAERSRPSHYQHRLIATARRP